jgi:hypothetical protein
MVSKAFTSELDVLPLDALLALSLLQELLLQLFVSALMSDNSLDKVFRLALVCPEFPDEFADRVMMPSSFPPASTNLPNVLRSRNVLILFYT